MSKITRHILTGFFASFGLILFYLAVMLLFTRSFSFAYSQFKQLWPWLTILIIGFGIQFGLYGYLKALVTSSIGTKITATNSGVSGISMVACCAHHLTDILPIIGFSAFSVFLTEYQLWFIGFGILSNFIGITYLVLQIRKHRNV